MGKKKSIIIVLDKFSNNNESLKSNCKVVALIRASTETKWWHDYVMKARELWFIKGRLSFAGLNQAVGKYTTQLPCMHASVIIVFDKEQAPHGPMLFEMTHFTDLCNWFLDSEPVEVSAMETGMLNHAILVKYAGGEIATLTLCANGTFGYPKELYEAMGNGSVVVCVFVVTGDILCWQQFCDKKKLYHYKHEAGGKCYV